MKKKGCLTGIAIFFALSVLFSMCSSDDESNDSSVTTGTTTPVTSTSTIPPHDHIFIAPTCIAPKTCSICGITDGETAEHTWIDATCLAPKTCSFCNATEGKKLEHNWAEATCTTKKTCLDCEQTTGSLAPHQYSNGKCKLCNEPDPSDPRNITVWIPTNGGSKYHSRSNCSNMKNPQKTTQDKAQAAGYTACSKCH